MIKDVYAKKRLDIHTGTPLPTILLGLGLNVHFTIGFYFRGVK